MDGDSTDHKETQKAATPNQNEQHVVSLDDHPPAAKRQKTGDTAVDSLTHASHHPENHDHQQDQLELAKKKLSKWAARLFDPNRPRGLVEAPKTIPLNDEFLTAFGKREKEHDEKLGRKIQINQEIQDEGDSSSEDEQDAVKESSDSTKKDSVEGRKIKIVNLAYTTSEETLEKACQTFGPVEHTNLLMDKERPNLNQGRAYVTFESTSSADACIEGLETLDGRTLRVSIAAQQSETKRTVRKAMGGGTARYWVKDISTKCFRCGQVGHMVDSCPNAAILKPCPLCGGFTHDMRACPSSRICFKCGVPGHINRECTYRENLPKRVICGICFQSGHHRCSCRRRATDAPSQDAKCFVCKQQGHFMCRQMKWFFGLDSVSCFNCGRKGHVGYDCDRPGIDVVARDDQLADQEIERAETISLADEVEQQARNRARDRGRGYSGGNRSRAKSQPPPRQHSNNGGGRGGGGRGNRGYAPQQYQQRSQSNKRGYDQARRR